MNHKPIVKPDKNPSTNVIQFPKLDNQTPKLKGKFDNQNKSSIPVQEGKKKLLAVSKKATSSFQKPGKITKRFQHPKSAESPGTQGLDGGATSGDWKLSKYSKNGVVIEHFPGLSLDEIQHLDPSSFAETKKAWRRKIYNAKAKGFEVGECFKDLLAFLQGMGFRPYPTYQIDRVNPEVGYFLDNIRWASPQGNLTHRRSSAEKISMYMAKAGCKKSTAYAVLNNDPEHFNQVVGKDFAPDKYLRWGGTTSTYQVWSSLMTRHYPGIPVPAKLPPKDEARISNLHDLYQPEKLQALLAELIPAWSWIHDPKHGVSFELRGKLQPFPNLRDIYRHHEVIFPWLAISREDRERLNAKLKLLW